MSADRKSMPQDSDVPIQDFQLVQALHEAREMARERDDAEGWRSLADSLDRILRRMGTSGGPPEEGPEMGIDRVDRRSFDVEPETSRAVVSALMALTDQPDGRQLGLAQNAVADFENAID